MSYATVQDLRDQGVPTTIVDGAIQTAIDQYTGFIERACRQWFEPRALTLDVDGNDSGRLFLPVPVISVSAMYINYMFDTANVLDPNMYRVYNGRNMAQDDRRNPKVELISGNNSIFSGPPIAAWTPMGPLFIKGPRNQRIVGVFGYTEDDGSTPPMIKRALMKLCIRQLKAGWGNIWNELDAQIPAGKLQSENVDGHSVSYDNFRIKPSNPGLDGITNDQEVDRILDMYRGPIGIGAPGSYAFWKG